MSTKRRIIVRIDKLARLVAVGLLVVLSGCATASSAGEGGSPLPEETVVKVYLGPSAPPLAFEYVEELGLSTESPPRGTRVGLVRATGVPADSWNRVLNAAKSEARLLGANVLVVERWEHGQIDEILFLPQNGKIIVSSAYRNGGAQ